MMQIPPPIPQEEFEAYVNERLEKTRHLILVKGKEYTRNNNPLHNFHEGAREDNITPERCLHDYNRKHHVSYKDILADIEAGKKIDLQTVESKLGDLILYFILQEVQLKHRIKNQ